MQKLKAQEIGIGLLVLIVVVLTAVLLFPAAVLERPAGKITTPIDDGTTGATVTERLHLKLYGIGTDKYDIVQGEDAVCEADMNGIITYAVKKIFPEAGEPPQIDGCFPPPANIKLKIKNPDYPERTIINCKAPEEVVLTYKGTEAGGAYLVWQFGQPGDPSVKNPIVKMTVNPSMWTGIKIDCGKLGYKVNEMTATYKDGGGEVRDENGLLWIKIDTEVSDGRRFTYESYALPPPLGSYDFVAETKPDPKLEEIEWYTASNSWGVEAPGADTCRWKGEIWAHMYPGEKDGMIETVDVDEREICKLKLFAPNGSKVAETDCSSVVEGSVCTPGEGGTETKCEPKQVYKWNINRGKATVKASTSEMEGPIKCTLDYKVVDDLGEYYNYNPFADAIVIIPKGVFKGVVHMCEMVPPSEAEVKEYNKRKEEYEALLQQYYIEWGTSDVLPPPPPVAPEEPQEKEKCAPFRGEFVRATSSSGENLELTTYFQGEVGKSGYYTIEAPIYSTKLKEGRLPLAGYDLWIEFKNHLPPRGGGVYDGYEDGVFSNLRVVLNKKDGKFYILENTGFPEPHPETGMPVTKAYVKTDLSYGSFKGHVDVCEKGGSPCLPFPILPVYATSNTGYGMAAGGQTNFGGDFEFATIRIDGVVVKDTPAVTVANGFIEPRKYELYASAWRKEHRLRAPNIFQIASTTEPTDTGKSKVIAYPGGVSGQIRFCRETAGLIFKSDECAPAKNAEVVIHSMFRYGDLPKTGESCTPEQTRDGPILEKLYPYEGDKECRTTQRCEAMVVDCNPLAEDKCKATVGCVWKASFSRCEDEPYASVPGQWGPPEPVGAVCVPQGYKQVILKTKTDENGKYKFEDVPTVSIYDPHNFIEWRMFVNLSDNLFYYCVGDNQNDYCKYFLKLAPFGDVKVKSFNVPVGGSYEINRNIIIPTCKQTGWRSESGSGTEETIKIINYFLICLDDTKCSVFCQPSLGVRNENFSKEPFKLLRNVLETFKSAIFRLWEILVGGTGKVVSWISLGWNWIAPDWAEINIGELNAAIETVISYIKWYGDFEVKERDVTVLVSLLRWADIWLNIFW